MKTFTSIIVSFMLIWVILDSKQQQDFHHETQLRLDSIQHELLERDHLDSLYHEHMSECSFISSEELALDSRGYLYSAYHKKY